MSNLRNSSSSKRASPARSVGEPTIPQRYRPRETRSVGSPARSVASGRLSNIVDQFKEYNKDSFAASPLNKTVTNDNTAIDMPRRKSWWRKVENSREMIGVPENEEPVDLADVFEEFGMVVMSPENNISVNLPESSGSESIHSIVVPRRNLFIQKEKENLPQKNFRAIASASETTNPNLEDQTLHTGTKKLFKQTTERTKIVFPAALLNLTNDNTLANKTKERPVEIQARPRGLFGNKPGNKRKNMFADLVVSESEDEILDIQPRRFTFNKPAEPTRRSSNASSVTTDIEFDDWRLLPSSTMMEQQLEAQLTTPGKRARLSKLSEAKETTNSDAKEKLDVEERREQSKHEVNKKDQDKSEKHELQAERSTLGKKEKLTEHSVAKESTNAEVEQKSDVNEGMVQTDKCQVEAHLHHIDDEELGKHPVAKESTDTEGKQKLKADEKNQSNYVANKVCNELKEDENNQHIDDQKLKVGQEIDQQSDFENIDAVEIQATDDKNQNQSQGKGKEDSNYSLEKFGTVAEAKEPTNYKNELKLTVDEEQKELNKSAVLEQHHDHGRESMAVENDKDVEQKVSQETKEQQEDKQIDRQEEVQATEDEIQNQSLGLNYQDQSEHVERLGKISEAKESINTEAEQEAEADEDEEQSEHTLNEEHLNEEDENNRDFDAQELEVSQEVEEQPDDEHSDRDEEIQATDEEDPNDNSEIEEEVENESQEDEEQETSQEMNEDVDEQNDSQEIVEQQDDEHSEREEEIQATDEEDPNENSEIEMEVQNESQDQDEEQETSQEMEEEDERNDSHEMEEEIIEASEEVQNEEETGDAEVTHDTTGRDRKKRETNTPEAILNDTTNEMYSFTHKGRNTSIKSIPKYFPIQQSSVLSDGTKNSSAEGSGWDSHRTTRKTLRQTFGKDFTPRKSLRALVMEKSAKRQTMINEAKAKLKQHQANSTELPDDQEGMEYEENVVESDHEVSRRMQQAKLDMYIQNFKKEAIEMQRKIAEEIMNPIKVDILYRPNKFPISRGIKKMSQSAPKTAKSKRFKCLSLENLPPELVEDMKYKPPKRFKPSNASWITKRLYSNLEIKLEPKYDYKARVRAEKLVETIYNFTRDIRRLRVAPAAAVDELKRELARLGVVRTHFEFYEEFVREYLPYEVRIKVIPDVINKIPVPTDLFGPII